MTPTEKQIEQAARAIYEIDPYINAAAVKIKYENAIETDSYEAMAQAALTAAFANMWQDISEAPKQGDVIIIDKDGHVYRSWYAADRWNTMEDWKDMDSRIMRIYPTHFMPLPTFNEKE